MQDLPYPSRRAPVYAAQAVATSQPLAAQAGLSILAEGGNAVDAAVAAAITLTVVEPTMNGVGSDLFALVWDPTAGKLAGLNASGRAPAAWTRERFGTRSKMPALGWDAVTVPGAVSGWSTLSERFGRVPFERLARPAIAYAQEGFCVSPQIAGLWAEAPERFRGFEEFFRVFLPGGKPPAAGALVRFPDLAATLAEIGSTRGRSFYHGNLARRIADAAQGGGGALTAEDLARHAVTWDEPIALDYRGARVHEMPPNGQGLAALIALGVLVHLPVGRFGPEHVDTVHWQIEAMKVAFADCRRHVADPARMRVTVAELLAPSRLARLAARIRADRAGHPGPQPLADHGTVYLAASDRDGMMVSLIQSNYLGFGSGIVVPDTGISLQNRGLGFSLDPGHPNVVQGGARPYHTIMPGFLTRDGFAAAAFGVMGGHMQPQGHVQLVVRLLVYGQSPQDACDAPRWHVTEDGHVALEPGFPDAVKKGLERRGHRIVPRPPTLLFGGAQIIQKREFGYCAASDPRKDGQAVGF